MSAAPDLGGLLEAAAAALRTAVLPQLSGGPAYEARVIAGVLEIAARELHGGAAADAAEAARLRALLETDEPDLVRLNRELARRLHSGAIDPQDAALIDHLTRSAAARIAIDQPSYARYREYESFARND